METLFWMVALPLVLLALIVLARIGDQRDRDQQRQCYRLSFPAELTNEQVLTYVYAISGTLRPPIRLLGTPNPVFEVVATHQGYGYWLWVPGGPGNYQHYILKQLRSHVAGIRIEPEDDTTRPKWKRIVELRQRNSTRLLRIYKPEATSISLLGSMEGLAKGEAVSLQVVVSPAVPRRKPRPVVEQRLPRQAGQAVRMIANAAIDRDKTQEERLKLDEPNFALGLRIAAAAKTDGRARKLVADVRGALASTRTAHTSFKQRLILSSERLATRFAAARGPMVFQITVAASELVALLAWPIGDGYMPGVPRARSRHLPPSPIIPSSGRLIAHSNFGGGNHPLAMTAEDACKHLHVIGPTGVGKTTLLANLVKQDMEAGAGVIVIDSKGDEQNLFIQALNNVPPSRVNDVVVMDVSDQKYPVGFNILAQGSPSAVLSDLQAIFNALYSRGGVRVPAQFFHGIMALMTSAAATKPLTFTDLVPLFSPAGKHDVAFGDAIIRGTPDDFQRNWWQFADNRNRAARDVFFSPVMERIWQLNNRPEIRHIIGQSESSFDMREVVRRRKILLVNLAGMGDEIPSLLGSLLVNALWHAVRGIKGNPSRPTFLYLDEFHKFTYLPISLADMLAQARSFGLAMILAHQNLSQLTLPEVRDAVMANARSKVVFQNDSDARILADMFGKPITPEDIKHLGSYDVVMRVAHGGSVSDPVTAKTLPPLPKHGLEAVVREESRKRYGRPVEAVAEEIRERPRLVAGAQALRGGRRPKLGPQPLED